MRRDREREHDERALQDRLLQIESELDDVAEEALTQGLRIRISSPTGDVIPEFLSPAVPKEVPALRLVRYASSADSGRSGSP